MFCPQCGRNLEGGENFCPECGYILQRPSQTVPERPSASRGEKIIYFMMGLILMFLLSFYIGAYFMFLFLPIFVAGSRLSRWQSFMIGAFLGTAVGMLLSILPAFL